MVNVQFGATTSDVLGEDLIGDTVVLKGGHHAYVDISTDGIPSDFAGTISFTVEVVNPEWTYEHGDSDEYNQNWFEFFIVAPDTGYTYYFGALHAQYNSKSP